MNKFKTHISQSKSSITFFPIIVFLFCIVFADIFPTLNNLSLYFIIPILFFYFLPTRFKVIIRYKPIYYFFLLLLWSSVTAIFSFNLDNSLAELNTILGCFIFSFVLVCFIIKQYKYIFLFYVLYILKFIAYCYRALMSNELDIFRRINVEDINANMYGYYGFMAIISSFFLWQHLPRVVKLNKRIKSILFLIFIFIIVLSLTFNFYSASRAGISISILTSILLLFSHFSSFSKKSIFQFILLLIFSFSLIYQQEQLIQDSIMQDRFRSTNFLEDSRYSIFLDAYTVGLSNIIMGIGPGNFALISEDQKFSHNTFLEILVNNGIFGLFLFLAILKNYFTQSIKLYRFNQHSRSEARPFLIFLLMFIIYNFFYVFHTSMFLISFLFIISIHQNQLLNFYSKQNQKENNAN